MTTKKNDKNEFAKVNEQKSRKQKFSTFLSSAFLCLIVGGITSGVIGGMWVLSVIAAAPSLDVNQVYAPDASFIMDRDGNVIAELGVQRREWVQFDDIAPVMIDAILATEDARFFNHNGVDWTRTIAANIFNVQNMVGGADAGLQGGSTITQQLIKQSHLTDEQTIERKLQEMHLSIQLERVLSKEQIVEAYLNFSPFGGNIHGIQAASEFYFGKSVSDLTLSEAATLAGIVQAPNVWRPDWFADFAQMRRDTVLDLMVLHGYITPELRDLAAAEPISDKLVYSVNEFDRMDRYQSFIDVVLDEAETRFDINPFGGYRIFTTMDSEAQNLVYEIQNTNTHITWPNENTQTGIVFMETDTGKVRAIGGGSNDGERTFNLATHLERQPGSTSKPIFAYGAAMEYLGWGTGTMIDDELYAYRADGRIINNWDRQFRGRVSLRQAMDWSYNVPAVKAYNAVIDAYGPEVKADFITRLGIPVTPDEIHESMALGGVATGYSPLQMAAAYAAFGNGGTFNEPITIERIETSTGEVIYQSQHSERVMSPETAYLMTDMLHTAMTQGTGARGLVPSMFLSGKTGSSNFPDEIIQRYNMPWNAVRDAWFVGYSEYYTAAIWAGYEDTREGHFITVTSQTIPSYIFATLMSNLNPVGSGRPLRPENIVASSVELESGSVDGEVCMPSSITPTSFIRTELFISEMAPGCVSNRFSQPSAPTNLTVNAQGTTLAFNWNHIPNHTGFSRDELQSAIGRAVSLTAQTSFITDQLRNLNPSESEARSMLRQLDTFGGTEYVVFATLSNGSTRQLTTTRSNQASVDVSHSEMASFQSFHVRTRFSNQTSLISPPSNVVENANFGQEVEIDVPNMEGWSRAEVEEWAPYGITIQFMNEPSENIPEGYVVSTSPSDRVTLGQMLIVFISTGPEPVEDPEPEIDNPVNSEEIDEALEEPMEEILNIESSSRLFPNTFGQTVSILLNRLF